MGRKIGTIIGVVVAALACVGIVLAFSLNKEDPVDPYPTYDEVKELSDAIDVSGYDINSLIAASPESGNIAEHVEGDLSKAKVVIYEYADYQCDYCAMFNPTVNQVLDDFGEDVAVIYRSYLLPYHKVGVQAALAAEAADRQGYWQEFKDLLFTEQDDWFYSGRTKFQKQVEEFFARVSGGKGNLAKFREDMRDENNLKKIAFDMAVGSAMELEGTPSFYINGEKISINELHDKVGELLGA